MESSIGMNARIGPLFNPLDEAYMANPDAFFARARREEPIFFSPALNMWVISRYDDILTIAKDPKRFSSAYLHRLMSYTPEAMAILMTGVPNIVFPLTTDPPDHTRLRKPLIRALSAQRVANLEPDIRQIVTGLIDQMMNKGQIDLMKRFAQPLPTLVIFRLLGLPDSDLEQVGHWVDDFFALLFGRAQPQQQVACAQSYLALQGYLLDLMEQRRISPQHDFPSDLLQAVEEEQVQLNDAEILGLFLSLISARVETTTGAIGMAVYHLLKKHNFWQAMQQKPALIPRVVEELLRLDGPSLGLFRLTTEEVVLSGVRIPKDAMLYLVFDSANHDEAIFAQGDSFDPYRENLNRHLTFSYGMHFCVGAPLARLELRVALEELSHRLPSLRLVPGQPLSYVPSLSVRGPLQLLVE